MSFLQNKKGSLVVLNDTSNNLEKITYSDDQKIVFTNSKKVKIIFNRPEYKINTEE